MQAAPNILHIVVIMCVVCAVVGRGWVRKRKEERGDASSPTPKIWNMAMRTHASSPERKRTPALLFSATKEYSRRIRERPPYRS